MYAFPDLRDFVAKDELWKIYVTLLYAVKEI